MRRYFYIPLGIVGGLLFLMILVFVILLVTLPIYEGKTCFENLSIGYQRSCECGYLGLRGDAAYFNPHGNSDLTAYQYLKEDVEELSLQFFNRSYEYEEKVRPSNFTSFNMSFGYFNEVALNYHFKLSAPAHVVLMSTSYLKELREGHSFKTIVEDRFVTEIDRTVNSSFLSGATSLVIINPNPSEIEVKESGWVYNKEYVMDEQKAMKVCKEECVFDPAAETVIFVDYKGNNRSVPVTMLNDYGMTLDMGGIVVAFPCYIGLFIIAEILLIIFCLCTPKELKETPEGKVTQDGSTAMDTFGATPAGAPPTSDGVAYAGTGPESEPPPADTFGSTPAGEGPSSVPYPGQQQQLDVYGIPIA